MEGQRDERLEPARLVLKLAQADQVVDPVQGLVDMAVEHGRVRVQPQPVGRAVDVEPLLGRGLGAADLLANLGMEDLGSAARQTAQPGVDQLPEDLLGRQPGDLGEELDLDRRVRLDVNLGGRLLDPAHHVHVVRERQLVMQSADDVQLGRPPLAGLPGPLDHRGTIHHVGLGLVQVGPEGTEIASVDTHVRRVDVRVDVVVAEIAVVPLAHQVGHRAEGEQVVRGLQRQAVVEAQPLAGLDLLADRLQSGQLGRHAFILSLMHYPS